MTRITLKQLEMLDACRDGVEWFKKQKNKEAKSMLRQCVKDGYFGWANWYVSKLFSKPQAVKYAIYSAELAINNYEAKYPSDKRPREAIEAAKRWLEDPSEDNQKAAESAAWSAAWSAESAEYAAWSAEYAARFAAWSAEYAAGSAAGSAEYAAEYAEYAARSAAWSAAESAARSALIEKAIEILGL